MTALAARARGRRSEGMLDTILHAAIWAAIGSLVRRLPWYWTAALVAIVVLMALASRMGRNS